MHGLVSLDIFTGGPELVIRMPHDPNWMDEQAVRRVLGHFQSVLAAMCADADAKVASIAMIGFRKGAWAAPVSEHAGRGRPHVIP